MPLSRTSLGTLWAWEEMPLYSGGGPLSLSLSLEGRKGDYLSLRCHGGAMGGGGEHTGGAMPPWCHGRRQMPAAACLGGEGGGRGDTCLPVLQVPLPAWEVPLFSSLLQPTLRLIAKVTCCLHLLTCLPACHCHLPAYQVIGQTGLNIYIKVACVGRTVWRSSASASVLPCVGSLGGVQHVESANYGLQHVLACSSSCSPSQPNVWSLSQPILANGLVGTSGRFSYLSGTSSHI